MPANKNAYMRYKVLDECFRDWGKRYTWEKLQERVNAVLEEAGYMAVSISTLRADVKFLQSDEGGAIPLKTYRDGHVVYLRYDEYTTI